MSGNTMNQLHKGVVNQLPDQIRTVITGEIPYKKFTDDDETRPDPERGKYELPKPEVAPVTDAGDIKCVINGVTSGESDDYTYTKIPDKPEVSTSSTLTIWRCVAIIVALVIIFIVSVILAAVIPRTKSPEHIHLPGVGVTTTDDNKNTIPIAKTPRGAGLTTPDDRRSTISIAKTPRGGGLTTPDDRKSSISKAKTPRGVGLTTPDDRKSTMSIAKTPSSKTVTNSVTATTTRTTTTTLPTNLRWSLAYTLHEDNYAYKWPHGVAPTSLGYLVTMISGNEIVHIARNGTVLAYIGQYAASGGFYAPFSISTNENKAWVSYRYEQHLTQLEIAPDGGLRWVGSVYFGPARYTNCVAVCRDGRIFVSAESHDGKGMIIEIRDDNVTRILTTSGLDGLRAPEFLDCSPNNEYLAVANSYGENVFMFSLEGGQLHHQYTFNKGIHDVKSVAFLSSTLLLIADGELGILVVSTESWEIISKINVGQRARYWMTDVAAMADGTIIATTYLHNEILVYTKA